MLPSVWGVWGAIARTLMIAQATDILTLLPVGALADRRGTARVLGAILVVFAAAMAPIGFGTTLPMLQAGCVLFGLSMAGWMLPLGVLRAVTSSPRVAWRLSLYRVVVDGGMFLGPLPQRPPRHALPPTPACRPRIHRRHHRRGPHPQSPPRIALMGVTPGPDAP